VEGDDNVVAAAEATVARQTDTTIAGIRARLDAPGSADCRDCGEEIEPARRAALPSATRCVACQGLSERRGKH
jgi:phage/conjugal plasmid C-4 type zinc finger TraR family protein